ARTRTALPALSSASMPGSATRTTSPGMSPARITLLPPPSTVRGSPRARAKSRAASRSSRLVAVQRYWARASRARVLRPPRAACSMNSTPSVLPCLDVVDADMVEQPQGGLVDQLVDPLEAVEAAVVGIRHLVGVVLTQFSGKGQE